MMKSIPKPIQWLAASILVASVSVSALAFGGHHGGRLDKALDLTDAQMTQIHSIREANKADHKLTRENFQSLMQKKQALMDNYSASGALEIAEEESALHKSRILKMLEQQQAIYAVLDDSQKAKYKELMQHGPKQRMEKKNGRPDMGDMPKPPSCDDAA